MKKQRNKFVATLLFAVSAVLGGTASAATLNDIFAVADELNSQARQSQSKIDALTEETRQLLSEYKVVLKEIQGLRVYNRQLEKQIANQEAEMAQLSASIDEVTIIERQITPLMLRMIASSVLPCASGGVNRPGPSAAPSRRSPWQLAHCSRYNVSLTSLSPQPVPSASTAMALPVMVTSHSSRGRVRFMVSAMQRQFRWQWRA